MNLKLQITNYKLLKDVSVELLEGNVYLIKGANEKGKTSFQESFKSLVKAKNDTKFPVTIGEKEAQVIGIIETKDGATYSVTMEATNDGKTKFTMIDPKGLKTNSVTSIRSIFNYQDFSAEEFVSLGNTAEGRRKQVEILLQCFPKPLIEKYKELEEKEKINFDKRTPILNEYSYLTKKQKEFIITEDQINFATILKDDITKDIEAVLNDHAEYEKKYAEWNSQNQFLQLKKSSHDQRTNEINKTIEDATEEIKRLERLIADKKQELNLANTSYQEFLKETVILEEPVKVDIEEVNEAKTMEKTLNDAIFKYNEYVQINEELSAITKRKDEYDDKIATIRNEKAEIVQSSKIFDDVIIEEDGIYIKNENGLFPFSDKQISTSTQIMLAIKILLKINNTFPLICIGRGESLDQSRLKTLTDIAAEEKAIIVVEKVVDSGGLTIEAIVQE